MGMEDRIFRVLVPVEEKVHIKDGKPKHTRRKIFPSYVLVEMVLEDQSWYVVRHTPGVTGFVGSGNHPIPLKPKEVSEIMSKLSKDAKAKLVVPFAVGDLIQVKSGPFAGHESRVIEVDDKGKVKFNIVVFGRETIIEADSADLEKIEDEHGHVAPMQGFQKVPSSAPAKKSSK